MKKLLSVAAALLLALLFSGSCGKSDKGGEENLLIGNWRALRATYYEIKDGVREEGEVVWDGTPENELIWTISADGTFTWVDHSAPDNAISGEWTVSGKNLFCSPGFSTDVVIEKLTSTELVVFGRRIESGVETRGSRYYFERI